MRSVTKLFFVPAGLPGMGKSTLAKNIRLTIEEQEELLTVSTNEDSVILDKKTEDFIKCGRRWVTAFITINLIGLTAYMIWVEMHFDPAGRG